MRLSPALILLPLLLAGCGVRPSFPMAPEGSTQLRTYPDPALDPQPAAGSATGTSTAGPTGPAPSAAATAAARPTATVPSGSDIPKPVSGPETRTGLPAGTATTNTGTR